MYIFPFGAGEFAAGSASLLDGYGLFLFKPPGTGWDPLTVVSGTTRLNASRICWVYFFIPCNYWKPLAVHG